MSAHDISYVKPVIAVTSGRIHFSNDEFSSNTASLYTHTQYRLWQGLGKVSLANKKETADAEYAIITLYIKYIYGTIPRNY